jgi:DNA-binding cell septation regulator SpoVG
MQVTEVKLYKTKKDSVVKAFGKATLENKLSLDVVVMDKGEGPWATFPNGKKGQDGKYYLPVFWKTKELNEAFASEVLKAYNEQIVSGATTTTNTTTAAPATAGEMPF